VQTIGQEIKYSFKYKKVQDNLKFVPAIEYQSVFFKYKKVQDNLKLTKKTISI